MADHTFDIIILGESLAARVAGISLAQKGLRVLTLAGARPSPPPWLFLSPALEAFLGTLGGRSCLTTPTRLQVLTPTSRTEINGPIPLAEELQREFPAGHGAILALLDTLSDTGRRLEEALATCQTLPLYGLASHVTFLKTLFRHKVPRHIFKRPLNLLTDALPDPLSREFVRSLFEGLSLAPADQLTEAEAALLWRGALQPRGISHTALDTLLRQRYEQFHGETGALSEVESLHIQRGGGRLTLKNGRGCAAGFFLFGDSESFSLLPAVSGPVPPPRRTFVAEVPAERVSPLLAPRIALSGDPFLRVTLFSGDNTVTCVAEPLGNRPASDEAVASRLKTLLPFAPMTVLPSSGEEEPRTALPTFPWGRGGVRLKKKNFLCCSAEALFPSLGTTGEVLLGLSCAQQVLLRTKKAPSP